MCCKMFILLDLTIKCLSKERHHDKINVLGKAIDIQIKIVNRAFD